MAIITDEPSLLRAGFHWRSQEGVMALCSKPLERDGFANAFSTRLGGCSPMAQDALNLAGFSDDVEENIFENRRRFLQLFENTWSLATCFQEHGKSVRIVNGTNHEARQNAARCDALVTNSPGILLAVQTADCIPILLGDSVSGACAAVHAGWRGTAKSITAHALESMSAKFGTQPENVRAAIGPAARACCYVVGSDVIAEFTTQFTFAQELLAPEPGGRARIDLQKANYLQLLAAGVAPERISIAPLCTMCRNDLFFSYRREKQVLGRVGRLLSVIGKEL